jgi:methyl-accepting chemotaxis protein
VKLKLRAKILIPVIAIIVPGLAAVTVVSYIAASAALQNSFIQSTEQLARTSAKQADDWVSERLSTIKVTAEHASIAAMLTTDTQGNAFQETIAYLGEIKKEYKVFQNLGVLDERGLVRASTDPTQIGKLDLSARDYFKKAMGGEANISGVLMGASSKKPLFVVAAPIQSNGSVIGVLYGSVEFSQFSDAFVANMEVAGGGYAYMMDPKGIVIAHPVHENIFNLDLSKEDFGQRMITEKSGSLEYNWEKTRVFASFKQVPSTGWIFVARAEYNTLFAEIRRLQLFIVLISAVTLAAVIGMLTLITRRVILRRIRKTVDNLRDISEGEGDLTRRIQVEGEDELDQLATYVNKTLENLSAMFVKIKRETEALQDSGGDLSSSMTQTAAAINEITANIESIKERVLNQSAGVTEAQATVQEISGNIVKLDNNIEEQAAAVTQSSSSIEEMVATIQSVTTSLRNNTESMEELQKASETGRGGMEEVALTARTIAKESEGLTEASEIIGKIASQTNLLAMNAAIEAAHAGEAGKGFAVVADEIRKLAEEAGSQGTIIGESLKSVKDSIDAISKSLTLTQERFDRMYTLSHTVSEQEAVIKNAMDEQEIGSRQVLEALSEIREQSTKARDASKQMTTGSKEVLDEMQRLAQISDEISQSMNEMAAGSNQINEAVNHVSDMAQGNNRSIESLSGEVSRFKTEA